VRSVLVGADVALQPYADPNYRTDLTAVFGDDADLAGEDVGNDRASSLKVLLASAVNPCPASEPAANEIFSYSEFDFGGVCEVFTLGKDKSLANNLVSDNEASSVKVGGDVTSSSSSTPSRSSVAARRRSSRRPPTSTTPGSGTTGRRR
jgi:hypothetical protein